MKLVSVMTTDGRGGAEYAALDMLEALCERGHEVVMLTNRPHLAPAGRVRVRPVDLGPKLSRRSYGRLAVRAPQLAWRLRRELERETPYDVLLVHFKKEQLLAATLPDRLTATLAWAEWGPVPPELRRGLPRWAYLRAARHVKLVMAVSEGTARSVCAVGIPQSRVHVVPNALNVQDAQFSAHGRRHVRECCGIPQEALVVGCISRFHPKKRNDVAIDAVVSLDREDVHLVMAGEGPEEPALRARAQPLGARAHFIKTPGAQIAQVCSALDVSLFCPSPTEGAPLAVIHSMMAGRPVLASGSEGVADLIAPGAGAIASPEHDSAALSTLLEQYLTDADRRRREGGAGAIIAAREFAAPAVATRIERLLSSPAAA